MRKPVFAIFIICTILCVLSFPPAMMSLAFTGAFPKKYFYILSVWPISAVIGPILAWNTRRRFGTWALIWFVPCFAYALFFLTGHDLGS